MNNDRTEPSSRSLRRRAIERVIAQYPAISDEQLHRLFDYFRREATPADLTRIATNPAIRPQYRQLCRDHRIDRLRFVQRLVAIVAAVIAALGLASFVAGS
jgi:murein endopeptidase